MDRTAKVLTTVLAACAIVAAAASAFMQSSLLAAIAAASAAAAAVAALAGSRQHPVSPAETPTPSESEPAAAQAPAAIQIATDTLAVPAFRPAQESVGTQGAGAEVEESRDEPEAETPQSEIEPELEPETLLTEEPEQIVAVADALPAVHGFVAPAGVEARAVVAALFESAHAAGSPTSAYLWMEDPATASLRLVAAAGTVSGADGLTPLADTLFGMSLESGETRLATLESSAGTDAVADQWRWAIPLVAGEQRGVAAIDFVGHVEPDADALVSLTAHARGALTGALALHVAREETAAARLLLDAASQLSGLTTEDDITAVALKAGMELAGSDTGSVMLADENATLRIVASKGLPDDVVANTAIGPGEGIAGWVALTGRPVVIEDPDDAGDRARRHGVRSAVSVPIADDRGSLGVLNVGSRTFQPRLSRTTLAGLEVLGRVTATTLRCATVLATAEDECFDTLKALNAALEASDPFSENATERILALSEALASELGLSAEDARTLRVASVLHDIGMAAAGETVFVGDRPLSTVEWGMLKVHPVIAADVLAKAPALRSVVPIVYHHHERWDGSGYVAGLAGERIPLGARILAVADAFVAMTSQRPYRTAMSAEEALRELKSNAGSQFDPDVVGAFDALAARGVVSGLGTA